MPKTYHNVTIWILLCCMLAGCGTTKSQRATEQLLISDAVDRAVANIDFRPLSGQSVYLDTQYIKQIKGDGVVNANYIISALRQQMLAANCLLQDNEKTADYIVEARVGALGTDSHDVVYGIPASRELSTAASLLPNGPLIPPIPEIAIAKRQDEMGATKIVAFAYRRDTRQRVWQSGVTKARSKAKNVWVFGAGPFQSGTVYDRTQFAGEDLEIPLVGGSSTDKQNDPLALYNREITFVQTPDKDKGKESKSPVLPAGYQQGSNAAAKPAPARGSAKKTPPPPKDAKPSPSATKKK